MITLVVAPSFLHLVAQVVLGSGSSSVSHLQKDALGRPLKPELGIPAAEFDIYFFTWYLAFLICWWLRHRATVFYHLGFCHERLILSIFTEEMAEPLMTICLSFGRSPGFGHKMSPILEVEMAYGCLCILKFLRLLYIIRNVATYENQWTLPVSCFNSLLG